MRIKKVANKIRFKAPSSWFVHIPFVSVTGPSKTRLRGQRSENWECMENNLCHRFIAMIVLKSVRVFVQIDIELKMIICLFTFRSFLHFFRSSSSTSVFLETSPIKPCIEIVENFAWKWKPSVHPCLIETIILMWSVTIVTIRNFQNSHKFVVKIPNAIQDLIGDLLNYK